jgi:hypothetical protein
MQPRVVLVGDQDLRDVALFVVAKRYTSIDQRVGEPGEGGHVASGPYPCVVEEVVHKVRC